MVYKLAIFSSGLTCRVEGCRRQFDRIMLCLSEVKVEKTLKILRETTSTDTRMSWSRYERGRGAENVNGVGWIDECKTIKFCPSYPIR